MAIQTGSVASLLQERAAVLERELGRYFKVARIEADRGTYMCDLGMPDCLVDEYWHQREKASDFGDYTRRECGAAILHINDYELFPAARGEGPLKWVATYEKLYGPLDQVWFTGPDGDFDAERFEAYRAGGEIRASWKCNPLVHDEGVRASWRCNPGVIEEGPIRASWRCNPGVVEEAPLRASWRCNPGVAEEPPIRASWRCNPGSLPDDGADRELQTELSKALLLASIGGRAGASANLQIPAGHVADYWKAVSGERRYEMLARHLTNQPMPYSAEKVAPSRTHEWTTLYERMFGPVSSLWFDVPSTVAA